MAGDWHGDTAWAIRAVRKMSKLATRPRWLMHGHLHLDYQRRVGLGGGLLEITGLDRDGADHGNWAILEAAGMRWLHFQGKPVSNAIRGLTGTSLARRLEETWTWTGGWTPKSRRRWRACPSWTCLTSRPLALTSTGLPAAGWQAAAWLALAWLALGWLALVLGAVPFLARSEDQDAFLGPGWKSCSSGLD